MSLRNQDERLKRVSGCELEFPNLTAAGISPECAAEHVRAMHGPYRIPTLLKRIDSLCRNAQQ